MRFISSIKYFHSFVHDFWKDYSETNPLEKFKLSGNASNNNMTGWTSSCLDSYRNLAIHLQYFHEYVIIRVKIVILTSDIDRQRNVSTWHHKATNIVVLKQIKSVTLWKYSIELSISFSSKTFKFVRGLVKVGYYWSSEKFLSFYKEIMDAQHFSFYIILSNHVWSILFYQDKDHNFWQIRFHVCIKMHCCKRRVCKRKTLFTTIWYIANCH